MTEQCEPFSGGRLVAVCVNSDCEDGSVVISDIALLQEDGEKGPAGHEDGTSSSEGHGTDLMLSLPRHQDDWL